MYGPGGNPAVEPTLRIRPRRRATMAGRKARVSVTSESTLTRIISSSRPRSRATKAPLVPNPALFTRKSTWSPARRTSSITCVAPSGVPRSAGTTCAFTPCAAPRSRASASSRSRLRATRIRSCLSAAKSFAYSAPGPPDAPVISAVPMCALLAIADSLRQPGRELFFPGMRRAPPLLEVGRVRDDRDLEQILALQRRNLPRSIDPRAIADQGFVTVEHTLDVLRRMHEMEASILAREGGLLAGYALVMPVACRTLIPVLEPMFQRLERLRGPFFLLGQNCVDPPLRAHGG